MTAGVGYLSISRPDSVEGCVLLDDVDEVKVSEEVVAAKPSLSPGNVDGASGVVT